jgi:hypothetical protein
VWCDASVDGIWVGSFWVADANVGVAEEEFGIDVGGNARVGFEDLLELDVDELKGKSRRVNTEASSICFSGAWTTYCESKRVRSAKQLWTSSSKIACSP